jgi:hypothetical protein
MHGQEAAAGEEAERSGERKEENGRGRSSVGSWAHLFNQEETEEKERQDESGAGLLPGFFLAEHVTDMVEAQVEDDEVVEEADHDLQSTLSKNGARSNIPMPARS